jgi:hypothetical protein
MTNAPAGILGRGIDLLDSLCSAFMNASLAR